MAKKAEVDIVVNKDDALKNLSDVDAKLEELEKKGKGLWSRFYGSLDKDTRKALDKAGEAIGDSAKNAILGQVTSLGRAIAAPGLTTFGEAITKAHDYRREVQRVATSTGESFAAADKRIRSVAMSTGELPQTVMHYAGAVRALGGTWATASQTMAGYQDRALQLGRPLESLVGTAAQLETAFGVKSKSQVDRFFGTLDAYAQRSGVSAERLHRQWETFGDAFSRISGGDPTKFAGITAAFAASSKDPLQAARNQEFGMNLVGGSLRQVEARMRRKGKLKKNELLTDENGEISGEKYQRLMEFVQGDVIDYYGGGERGKRRFIEIHGETPEGRRMAAGFVNTRFSKEPPPAALPRTAGLSWRTSAAGRRERSDVKKYYRDVDIANTSKVPGMNMTLLDAQDWFAEHGGGGRGLAMSAGGEVVSTAVNQLGSLGLGGLGRFAAKKAGAMLATRAGAMLATAGMTGGALAGIAGIAGGGAFSTDEKPEDDPLSQSISDALHPEDRAAPMSLADEAPRFGPPEPPPAPKPLPGPPEVSLANADMRTLADLISQRLMQDLSSRVLKVGVVDTEQVPGGKPNL